jgi:hypothetical protein
LPSSSCYFKFSSYHLAVLRVVGGKWIVYDPHGWASNNFLR